MRAGSTTMIQMNRLLLATAAAPWLVQAGEDEGRFHTSIFSIILELHAVLSDVLEVPIECDISRGHFSKVADFCCATGDCCGAYHHENYLDWKTGWASDICKCFDENGVSYNEAAWGPPICNDKKCNDCTIGAGREVTGGHKKEVRMDRSHRVSEQKSEYDTTFHVGTGDLFLCPWRDMAPACGPTPGNKSFYEAHPDKFKPCGHWKDNEDSWKIWGKGKCKCIDHLGNPYYETTYTADLKCNEECNKGIVIRPHDALKCDWKGVDASGTPIQDKADWIGDLFICPSR